jgi:FtsP/CotA-like multicopper oxidase with cupredoxin domain
MNLERDDKDAAVADQGRRRVLYLGACLAAGGAVSALGYGPRSWAAAAVPAETLQEPPILASRNGVLQSTLQATTTPATVAGQTVSGTMTYNGHYPGPTLKVKPGDRIRLAVQNNLALPAGSAPVTSANGAMVMPANTLNTHFHGMHVSPLPKGDYIYLEQAFGESYDYDFQIPDNHPGGLYWYHPHVHTVVDAQIYAGLAGLLVVEGGAEQLPALRGATSRLLALKNIAIDQGALTTGVAAENQSHTVNGQSVPSIAIRPGETQLWRVANIGNDAYYQLSLDGHQFTVLAEDGSMLWESYTTDTLLLPPGKRFEFAVTGGAKGSYSLRTQGFNSGPFGNWQPAVLATLNVAGSADTPRKIPQKLGEPPAYLDAPVARRRFIRFSEGFTDTSGPYFELNGKMYEPMRARTKVKLGSVEEWLLYNDTNRTTKQGGTVEDHPFHIHVNNFVVTEIDGQPVKAYGAQDVVNVRPGEKILIRMAFPDYTGESVFHCHILFHEDNGMMANFEIVPD